MPGPKVQSAEMGDPVLHVQRAVSRAGTERELIYNFVRELQAIGEVHQYMELAIVPGREDAFVIADHIDMTDPGLTLETVMRHNKWPTGLERETIHTGGLLGEIIKGETPKVSRGVSPEDDPRLVGIIHTQRDALAVPIYFDGEITQWTVLFRAPGLELSETDVRLACAVVNMLSRGAYQLRLQRQVEAMHERERRKIEEIAQLQRSLLPQRLPQHPALDIAAHYRPSDLAGGDFYDFREFDNGQLGMMIADVAGHGPAAAVVMAMLRTAMAMNRTMDGSGDTVVTDINRAMNDGLRAGVFVTAFFLRLNPATGFCGYANAGHCPPRVRRAGGTIETLHENATPPLGVLEEIETPGGECTLQPGEFVVLFTDGINETFNIEHELYGYERLDTLILSLPEDASAQHIVDAVIADVDLHAAGRPADDDRCVVVLRYLGGT